MNDPDNQSAENTMRSTGTNKIYHHEGGNMPAPSHHDKEIMGESKTAEYWKANVRLLCGLLAIWFVVSFGAGILFVDQLNNFHLGGYPLGFWFAQQGSIYAFVGLIFFYAWRIKKIED